MPRAFGMPRGPFRKGSLCSSLLQVVRRVLSWLTILAAHRVHFRQTSIKEGPLSGVLLGWAAFPSILVALLLQALLFQFGGITVLGVNAFTMGFAAVASWYVFRAVCRLCPGMVGVRAGAFMGGALGVALAAVLTALALAFTDEGFWLAARLLLLAHLPIMLVEGLVTMFTVSFIMRVRPELLGMPPVQPDNGQEDACFNPQPPRPPTDSAADG